jgi:hypothetical protein
MNFFTKSKAVRLVVLGGALSLFSVLAPLALACEIVVPAGHVYICQCDKDCACVCIQIF